MRKKILFSILTLITALIFLFISYLLMPIKSINNIKLPSSNSKEIVNYLQQKGYNLTLIDSFVLSFLKQEKGWVYINKKELPRYKFLYAISQKNNHYTPITIIPGETTYFVLKSIAKKLDMNLTALENSYNNLAIYREGNFLANSYNIPAYFKERDTIKFILDHSLKKYKEISKKYYNNFDFNKWKKILTIASIVEKESASKKEMPIIASVIYNRLKKNMRLQMDGALNYGKYSHIKVTPRRIKRDKSSYNTYKFKGLPKNPVCNVSKNAIISAINPAKTNYLYFMKKNSKEHSFSITFKEHKKNIKKRKGLLQK